MTKINSKQDAKSEKSDNLKIYKDMRSHIMDWHVHDEYEMIYVQDGSVYFNIEGKEIVYEKNSLLFIGNLEEHKMIPYKEPYVRYVSVINREFFERFVGEPALHSIFKRKSDGTPAGIYLPECDSEFVHSELSRSLEEVNEADTFYEAYSMTSILRILIHLFRNNRDQFPEYAHNLSSKQAAEVQKYLDENFTGDISLDSLSLMFFINKYHLSRLFKELTGCSIKKYVNKKRITLAKDLLYYTKADVSKIAMDCGFNSTSNFIRAFKNMEDETPLCFRKKFK